jgi:hypothetical protein
MQQALLLLLPLMVVVVVAVAGMEADTVAPGVLLLLLPPLLRLLVITLVLLLLLLVVVVVMGTSASPQAKAGSSHSTYWSTSFSMRRLKAPGRWLFQYFASLGSGLLGAESSLSHAVCRWLYTCLAVCLL